MTKPINKERRMSISLFKSQCHALVSQISSRRIERIVLTRRGRPVAALVPHVPRWRGALKGTVFIPPGVDITEPTGEVWDAELDKDGIV